GGDTSVPSPLPMRQHPTTRRRPLSAASPLPAWRPVVADLSEDERRLLFEPPRAASRQEGVRLAVRRHRLRARLAALVDGMVAGIAFVRRLPKRRPSPVKAGLVATPIVAATLLLGPPATPPRPQPPEPIAGPPHHNAPP